jgi:alpha-beta hydrolase superfamily lysophospholipase
MRALPVTTRDEGSVTQRAAPGPALYFTSVTPDAPKAWIGLLHGYADHGARYAHVMDAWAEQGIGSVAVDMRGHGRAKGARGYCARFEEFLDDAGELTRLVRDRARGAACFLFGHSFGGLVAAMSSIESPGAWCGVVLSAPYLGLAMAVPQAKIVAAKVASRVWPGLALPTGIKGTALTHDPARAAAYDADPLVFKAATSRWFVETTRAQARAMARASSLALPLYVAFGEADPVASHAAGKAFFDAAGSKDKTWDGRRGLYHEILNEPEWPTIAKPMGEWVLAHV